MRMADPAADLRSSLRPWQCVDWGTVRWFVLVGACGGDGWGDREGTAAASGLPVWSCLKVRAVEVEVRAPFS
jgi:hypothetical protein